MPALKRISHPAPLPPKIARALWASKAGSAPQKIPRLFPWKIHRVFDDPGHSLVFVSGVTRQALVQAKERGQFRDTLDGRFKELAVMAWVTRNLDTDEILATYAQG